jgi:hypothetical protein
VRYYRYTFAYSQDGTNWASPAVSMVNNVPQNEISEGFAITHLGIFAGTTTSFPAYNAQIDWFRVDGSTEPTPTDPTPGGTFNLSLSTNPSAGGTITGATGGAKAADSTVTLTANANSGYVFAYWLVNGVEVRGTQLVLTMNENKTVQARFIELSKLDNRIVIPFIGR